MKKYKVTVKDDFFDVELSAEIIAETEEEAKEEARDFYAMELGTNMDLIEIVSVVELH